MKRVKSASRTPHKDAAADGAANGAADAVVMAEPTRSSPPRRRGRSAVADTLTIEAPSSAQDDAPVAAAPNTPPSIMIDIDPGVSGGFIHGRFDVQIRGRVASTAAIEEVELEADGGLVARTVFGQPERAPAIVMPDGTPGRQRAFQFSLPRLHARAGAPCPCVIRARTSDGDGFAEIFDLVVDPTGPEPVTVASGPTQPSVSYAGVRPPIVLYVERATLDSDGNLAVHGWAVAQTSIVTVQVFTAGNERLPAAQLGGQREDVANFYPSYPNARLSGFTVMGQLDPDAPAVTHVRTQAISMNGFASEVVIPVERVPGRSVSRPPAPALAIAPIQGAASNQFAPLRQDQVYQLKADFHIAPDPSSGLLLPFTGRASGGAEPAAAPTAPPPRDARREIHYYCDETALDGTGALRVTGWAVSAAGIGAVSIYLGPDKLGDAELGILRPDVGEEFGHIPSAYRAGFQFEQTVPDLGNGQHIVRIIVHNSAGDTHDETRIVTFTRIEPVRPEPEPEPPPANEAPEFRFELDSPQVVDGAVIEPITGRLTIEGWVLARSGVSRLEVFLNEQRLGEAHYGLARQDVGAAFPDWDNSLRSGYAFHCPPRSLRDGSHEVRLVVRATNGRELEHRFAIEVKKSEEDDELATIRRRMTSVESGLLADLRASLDCHPQFHLVLRQGDAIAVDRLRATFRSLTGQAYADWHLTAVTDSEDAAIALRTLVAEADDIAAEHINVIGPTDAGYDIAFAAGAPATHWYGLLFPGDELAVDALAEIALAAGLHRDAAFIYADESRNSPASNDREPFFKPDFSPDLLLSTNYIGRPWFATAAVVQRVGATPCSLLADGEYDLVLRCTEQAGTVVHVPRLLAQRGAETFDTDAVSRIALANAATRRDTPAEVLDGCLPGVWRLRRTAPANGKVAIIIPTCAAHGYIENCIASIRARTAYQNYEIVCLDNIPESQLAWKLWLQRSADRVIDIPDAFNWSRFNNIGVTGTDSEYLLFLNDDIEITQDDWLDVLLEHAQRPEVGIVGPQLLYPSGKVQHAGMFLGAGIGRHAFRFAPADDPGYFGLALTQRNVLAVTGACMLMRRSFFEALGRFDEAHSVINNDLDFCLRTHQAGMLTVFTPYASLIHHELASRENLPDVFDTSHFNTRWKTLFAAGDPYFSPRLSRNSDDYRPDDEPVQAVYPGHPLFRTEDIRRILVVKLDHIGDFVTALPAIRRLKRMFPAATISVLAGPHARGFANLEPTIDEFIEFEFFHARSQLGERELTKDDFLALRAQLAPHRFDLAVDLRKHLSTRDVLQYTGARFLAGYDYMGQYPFLDIALEWEGDKTLQRKRSHIVDDLLALVEAIGTASETDRSLMPIAPSQLDPETLPQPIRHLFDKPVVAVHPGAGNITKQWPVEYFSALIDLLTERNNVNVILVGGPDERDIADHLLTTLLRPDAVVSVAGQTRLDELPRLLSACVLYIGNDSGPKHIAAALGVPTIGIHSGVVDAIEWGPVGRRAVALRRNMTCSPCYLARAEDCPRALACLRHLEPALVHQTAEMLLARPLAPAIVESLQEVILQPKQTDIATAAEPSAQTEPGATETEMEPVADAAAEMDSAIETQAEAEIDMGAAQETIVVPLPTRGKPNAAKPRRRKQRANG